MLRTLALIFGFAVLVLGILGFFPRAFIESRLLGLFDVNITHNFTHLLTGIIAIWVGFTSEHASKVFFQAFGIMYGVVAILGYFYGAQPILGIVSNNIPDVWLHLAISIFSLYLGFVIRVKAIIPREDP